MTPTNWISTPPDTWVHYILYFTNQVVIDHSYSKLLAMECGPIFPCAPFYPDPEIESDLGVDDDGVVSQEEIPLGDIAANDASNDDEDEGDEHEDDDVK